MNCFYNVHLTISIIFLISPSCHATCEDFYIILNYDEDDGIIEFRPVSKEDVNITLMNVNSNNSIDDACILDLSCLGIAASTESPITVLNRKSTDNRYTEIWAKYTKITQPSYNTTVQTIDETTTIKTTIQPLDKPLTPPPDLLNLPKAKKENSLQLDDGKNNEIQSEKVTEEPPTATTVEIDNNTTDSDEGKIGSTEPSRKDESVNEKDNSDITVRRNSSEIGGENTTDFSHDKSKDAMLNGKLKQDESKHIASKIVAGTLGAVASVVAIFSVKALIQNYLKSGAYRIPDP